LATAALLVLSVVVFEKSRQRQERATLRQTTRIALVEQKDFVRTLRVHGIVEAVASHTIAAPRLSGQGLGSLIITKLVKNGSAVKRGDLLVEFDRQAQLNNVIDKQAAYRDLVEQIKKKQADQAAARAADETQLKQAEDAEKTAELEVAKNEILSQIDAEKNLLNLEEAKANLQQLRKTFELKRRSALADLRILEIQRDRASAAMHWAQDNSKKMVVESSLDGVAVVNSTWKGGTMSDIQEGDEVRAGMSLLQVVDPSRMQVRARINQADIGELHAGLPVRISLDAYPELSFPGRLESIGAVAQASSFSQKVRSFIVLFSVNGADARLLPDLSAAVDIELQRQKGQLVAPRDAIVRENDHTYVVADNGSSFEKREVKTGAVNDVEEVIVSGVERDAIVLRNPN
jgi:multidrug efflux pump subunit AcrA (membrane-fusion protein)